jgi:ribosome-associated protein
MSASRTSIPRPPRGRAARGSASTKGGSGSKQESCRIALLAAQAGLEKKATAVEIIDVSGKVDYADYLVLMTGASDRNVAAIAHEVDDSLSKQGIRSLSVEGLPAAHWVLIDLVDVVVHVFQRDVRSLYDLDGLWMDAERVPVPEAATPPKNTP